MDTSVRKRILELTGADDISEPLGRGLRDFHVLATLEKAFVDVMGATHMEVVQEHGKTPWLVNWCKGWAFGDKAAQQFIKTGIVTKDKEGFVDGRAHLRGGVPAGGCSHTSG